MLQLRSFSGMNEPNRVGGSQTNTRLYVCGELKVSRLKYKPLPISNPSGFFVKGAARLPPSPQRVEDTQEWFNKLSTCILNTSAKLPSKPAMHGWRRCGGARAGRRTDRMPMLC